MSPNGVCSWNMSWSQLEQEQLDKALVFTRDAAGAYGNAEERWTAIAAPLTTVAVVRCGPK